MFKIWYSEKRVKVFLTVRSLSLTVFASASANTWSKFVSAQLLFSLLHLLLFSCTTLATSIYNIFYFTLFNPIPDVVISSPTPCNNVFFLDPWPFPTFFHYFPRPIQVYSHFLSSFFSLFISSLLVFLLEWGSDVPLLGLPWPFLSFFFSFYSPHEIWRGQIANPWICSPL